MNFEQKESPIITSAIPEDAQGIQELTNRASVGMYKICGWTDEEIKKHFPIEKQEESIKKLQKNISQFGSEQVLLVSKDANGKVVGCCFLEQGEEKNRLEALYIEPEYQGAGLAQKIFDEAYAKLDHSKDLYLDVFSRNTKGVAFYKKVGFIETGKKFFDQKYTNDKGELLEIQEMVLRGK